MQWDNFLSLTMPSLYNCAHRYNLQIHPMCSMFGSELVLLLLLPNNSTLVWLLTLDWFNMESLIITELSRKTTSNIPLGETYCIQIRLPFSLLLVLRFSRLHFKILFLRSQYFLTPSPLCKFFNCFPHATGWIVKCRLHLPCSRFISINHLLCPLAYIFIVISNLLCCFTSTFVVSIYISVFFKFINFLNKILKN